MIFDPNWLQWASLAVIIVLLFLWLADSDIPVILFTVIVSIVVVLWVMVVSEKDPSASEREQVITEKKNTPHVIREADGCKVYEFYANKSTHYFTKCQNETTTDRSYSEQCGKTTCSRVESIVTENK